MRINPKNSSIFLIYHVLHQTAFELFKSDDFLCYSTQYCDRLLEKNIIVEVCDANVNGQLLHLVSFLIWKICFFGELIDLVSGKEVIRYFLIRIWNIKMNEAVSVGPYY